MGIPGGPDGKESACNVGDWASIPELGRSPGVVCGSALQYSCLENPMDLRSLADYSSSGRRVEHNLSNLACTHLLIPDRKESYHSVLPNIRSEKKLTHNLKESFSNFIVDPSIYREKYG